MAIFLTIPPRHEHENHREYIYRVLHRNIIEMTLKPNTVLNEAEIAAALNVSRTPVHEALKLLAKESLVDIIPSKETRVSKIGFPQIMDGLFSRVCLEPVILHRLMGQTSNEDIKLLQNNLRLQQSTIQTNDIERYYYLDDEFHKLVYLLANKARTYNLLSNLLNQYSRFRVLHYQNCNYKDDAKTSLEEHMQIFYAISISKPLPISPELFFRRHVGRSVWTLPELVIQYPDYFCGFSPEEFQDAMNTYLRYE